MLPGMDQAWPCVISVDNGSSARSQGPAAPQVLPSPELALSARRVGASKQRSREGTEQDSLEPTEEHNPNSVGLRESYSE